MPHIVFEAGRMPEEVKLTLIRSLTDLSAQVTGIPKHLFFVTIHELPDTDLAIGGETVSEIKEQLKSQENHE